MSDNNGIALPYDRVYILGDSLSSVNARTITVSVTLDFWITTRTYTQTTTIPNPNAYYSQRFCNGFNFFDHLKVLMPELPLLEENVFAYQGAGSIYNAARFQVEEKTDEKLGCWKWWESARTISHHPGFDEQYKKVIEKETKVQSEAKGKSLVFIWGAGVHNDIISLTYLAGYKNKWSSLSNITEDDVKNFSATLDSVATLAGEKLKENITKMYDVGIRDFVLFDGLPIEKTPYFADLKKKYTKVKGFNDFIDRMATTYNDFLHISVDNLQRSFAVEGKAINITYISSKDISLPTDLKSVSFLEEGGTRNGKEFNFNKMTPKEKKILNTLYFYDPIHLTTKGALMVANFIKDQLLEKEVNIKKYHRLCAQQKRQEALPNLDIQPKNQYIMVVTQHNQGALALGR